MSENQKPGLLRRILGGLWSGLTRVRVALSNIIFLALILVIFFAFRDTAPAPLPEKAALLLNPAGTVVEELSYTEPLSLFLSDRAPEEREVLLDDMIDAILIAKEDPKITALVMELDQLQGIGTSKTGELAEWELPAVRRRHKHLAKGGDVVAMHHGSRVVVLERLV